LATFILVFVFIFGWKQSALLDWILVTSAVIAGRSLFSNNYALNRRELGILVVMLSSVCLSAVSILVNGEADLEMLLRLSRATINFLGAIGVVNIYQDRYGAKMPKQLVSHVLLALVVHGALMVLMYVSLTVRETVYSLTNPDEIVNEMEALVVGLRVAGLTYGLSQTSLLQMWILILMPVAFLGGSNIKKIVYGSVFGAIAVSSVLVSGRTGLLLGSVAVPIIGASVLSRSVKELAQTVVNISAAFLVAYFAIKNIGNMADETTRKYTLQSTDEVVRLLGGQGSRTTDAILSTMYFFPSDSKTMFIGTGQMNRQNLGIATDVGYVRSLFAIGFPATALTMMPFIMGISWAARLRRISSKGSIEWTSRLALATALILASSLIVHGKEVALLTRNQWSVQAILLVLVIRLLGTKKIN
jgi:hypothetical protein